MERRHRTTVALPRRTQRQHGALHPPAGTRRRVHAVGGHPSSTCSAARGKRSHTAWYRAVPGRTDSRGVPALLRARASSTGGVGLAPERRGASRSCSLAERGADSTSTVRAPCPVHHAARRALDRRRCDDADVTIGRRHPVHARRSGRCSTSAVCSRATAFEDVLDQRDRSAVSSIPRSWRRGPSELAAPARGRMRGRSLATARSARPGQRGVSRSLWEARTLSARFRRAGLPEPTCNDAAHGGRSSSLRRLRSGRSSGSRSSSTGSSSTRRGACSTTTVRVRTTSSMRACRVFRLTSSRAHHEPASCARARSRRALGIN